MKEKGKVSPLRVVKYAGAYIAFEIGSGFATGQEILQFYTSYGVYSIGAALISMVLFAWVGASVMKAGYEQARLPGSAAAKPYQLLCGPAAGTFFEYFVICYLFAVLAVMVSGAGASLQSYFDVPYYIGGLLMVLLVFLAFAFGLSRLIDVVGAMGPLIIGFTIFVALCAVLSSKGVSPGFFSDADVSGLSSLKPASQWWLSGILYVAYNVLSSIAFLMALGKDAASSREAAAGGILGGVMLMVTVLFMNTALALHLDEVSESVVPALELAKHISPAAGMIFVIVMILGIFSTAAPMLWTICDSLAEPGKGALILALLVSLDALILGQLPFDRLIAVIYPYTGYLGLILLAGIARYQYRNRIRRRRQKSVPHAVHAGQHGTAGRTPFDKRNM